MKITKRSLFILIVLIAGFAGGLIVASNLEWTPAIIGQDKSESVSKSTTSSSARALADQLSDLFESASDKVSPSVVPIFSEQEVKVTSPFGSPEDPFRDFFGDDFFKHFFGQVPQGDQKQTVRGLGSGVIVSSDGYILTNNHVVDGAEKLTVIMSDQKKYSARVIGTDPQTDVAVIKIEAKNLPAVNLGNSDNVKVGQWVIAVGNPFQLLHTVTAGIISAKGRSSVGLADYEDFIQTDASINPGNSGGALADLDGNVIGINTAISSPSGGNVGIGFAIPINMARNVMDQLMKKGKITRGYLALVPQDIDDNLAKALKLKSAEGALVGDVTPDGPADKGGIKRGDIITEFNGEKVKNSTELRNMVAQTAPGTSVKISLLRDGRDMQVKVVLGERPRGRGGREEQPGQQQPDEQTSKKLGLSIQNLTPDLAQQLGYKNERGVVVTDVASGSPAEDAGVQQGDLIKEVNRVAVSTTREFNRIIARLGSGDSIALLMRRGENTFYAAIQLP
ncbi:MAG: DegQ family serine endoprotease [candidate division KSB1 bacterium]|nr:DegQ family serine endoprotease [candidate division KSB1 bacterium]MDZ7364547.1 DegQ family serine endoprotease [candidate division KSB1 bacterium]MDZ7405750.1 DegQ family serine endoprotease [candidate division KSB1 bacterium]